MTKSKAAFLFASQTLGKQKLFLWTFTFRELLAVKDTRKRWNHLLTLLVREWPQLQGLRVFELHEEHGLHVHLMTNRFTDVRVARELAKQAGWGRIHVTRMASEHAGYLANIFRKSGRSACIDGGFGQDSERVGNGRRLKILSGRRCLAAFTAPAKNGRVGAGVGSSSKEWSWCDV